MTTEPTPDDLADPVEPEPVAADAATDHGPIESTEPETFPREYVTKLREENARYRRRAVRADEAITRLLDTTVRTAAADHLADPTDLLTFANPDDLLDTDGWPDPDRITAVAQALAESKPHLAPRRPSGDIGQGTTPINQAVDLAALLRHRA